MPVETLDGPDLRYVESLVNPLAVEDLGQVSMKECLRVLGPNGVAHVKSGNKWGKTLKQWA